MVSKSIILALAAVASAAVIPTKTDKREETPTVVQTATTHTITVGAESRLVYSPDNVSAEVGDILEFHFLKKAHGVVQSSFTEPCKALEGGFSSGLIQVPDEVRQSDTVFQVVVEDTKPIWYYCPQPGGGEGQGHCQKGMVGAVNAPFDKANINDFRALALQFTGPPEQGVIGQGGMLIPNPNPLAGI